MEIRMANIMRAINESCVTSAEFPFRKTTKQEDETFKTVIFLLIFCLIYPLTSFIVLRNRFETPQPWAPYYVRR